MFRSATVKIAHSSTIPVPALIGNEALRPLQDLIAAEKVILTSLQKLSSDFAKAVDAMRTWALSEGDEISDVLSSSRTLLAHFSGALNRYSSIQNVVRDNMKAVRTREEFLIDLRRRRRRRAAASVETIKRKLTRMNKEHKAFGTQMYALNLAGEDMRDLDAKIASEESTIGIFKRKCTMNWMTLKFGGLAECCEKGMIVADIGKRMISGLSESLDKPYTGHSRMALLLSEAQHRIVQVAFSGTSPSHETSEAPPQLVCRSRPNCSKDLPEICEESLHIKPSTGYDPPIRSQSSTNTVSLPEHVLPEIGPSMPSTAERNYQSESSLSSHEPPLAMPPDRRAIGNASDENYSSFMRNGSTYGFRLDSIEEGDEPLPSPSPSPSFSSDIIDARVYWSRSLDLAHET